MAFDQVLPSSLGLLQTLAKGMASVSLTNYTSSAESAIAAGSVVEVASATFLADGDVTPQASTWTAITTGSTAYIALTPSGVAGSQTLTAKYSDTAPAWREDHQGWYGSAGSAVRYIGGVYKGGTASYDYAFLLTSKQAETWKATARGFEAVALIAHTFNDPSTTQNQIYDALDPYVPAVGGGAILVIGAINGQATVYAARASAQSIAIELESMGTNTVHNGSSTAVSNVILAW